MQQLHKVLLRIKLTNAFFLCLCCICFNMLNAQNEIINSPVLISSAGGTFTQNNFNSCFSLGEIAIETFVQSNMIVTQGFHQENYQISSIDEKLNEHEITLYPNPTQDVLYVNCNISESVDLIIKNIKGSILFSSLETDGSEIQEIYLSQFSQGIYFLEVGLNQNKKQVYKIQKLN